MQHLKLNHISYKYSYHEIFSNLNLDFTNGWSGIIGQNGSGKTTLLKLIAKQLKPQNGNISGNDLVYYCEQKLDKYPYLFHEFRDDFSSKRYKLQELLEIQDEWFYTWETLSFGERKRIQIAIALYSEADVLLLDEPTNHLDFSMKKIVIEALKGFKKIGLIVSHDREVLDTLCSNTIILKNNKIYRYKTNYSSSLEEFAKEQEALAKEYEKQDQRIKTLAKNIQSQKEKVSKIKGRFSKKNIDKNDSSTKEKINLAKLTGKDKVDSKKVDTLNTKLEHLNSNKKRIDKEYKKGIVLDNATIRKSAVPIVLKAQKLQLGGEKILDFPDIVINHGDKIAIVGDNGSGKSSFIKYLLSHIDQKDMLYLPQEIDELQAKELFESIQELSDEKKGELFTFVTRLSSNPKKLLDHTLPSPGELRKLLIAKAMLENISMIVLDEPTNHMDIDSILALEEALKAYDGTVILISHDRIFLENIVKSIWEIKENQLVI